MTVTPRTTLLPAIVPAKNLRPLKVPTSVTGAAAASIFAPSAGYADTMRTRALLGQARTAEGKRPPVASARRTTLATNRRADQTPASTAASRIGPRYIGRT